MRLYNSEHIARRMIGVDEPETSVVPLASQLPLHNASRPRSRKGVGRGIQGNPFGIICRPDLALSPTREEGNTRYRAADALGVSSDKFESIV